MKRTPLQPSEFFSRHRLAICALLLSCAMISVMMGHRLSVAHSKSADAPQVETASAGQSSSQG